MMEILWVNSEEVKEIRMSSEYATKLVDSIKVLSNTDLGEGGFLSAYQGVPVVIDDTVDTFVFVGK